MARGPNLPAALKHARASLEHAAEVKRRKDCRRRPLLDRRPQSWTVTGPRTGGTDGSTISRLSATMVRRPIGLYRHKWDAMQIQAPRNVLAETSIDMWALSYADPSTAKEVFVGQFLDAS